MKLTKILAGLIIATTLISGCFGSSKSAKLIPIDAVRGPRNMVVEKNIVVSKSVLEKSLQVPQTARIIAVFRGQEVIEMYPTYRVFDVKKGTTLELLGFKNGDVLEAVEGYVLKDPSGLGRYIELLPQAEQGSFDIIRAGQPVTLKITIVKSDS